MIISKVAAAQQPEQHRCTQIKPLYHLSLCSKSCAAEPEASNDETHRKPQHLPRPQGPDPRARVHRPRPVSAAHPIHQKIWSEESIITATHPSPLHPMLCSPSILLSIFGVSVSAFVHFYPFFFVVHSFHSLYSLFSPTPKVSWLRKDGEMSESRTSKDMFDRRLYFTNISESDGGEYQCIAENIQGRTFHTYTVTVEGTHTHAHKFIRSLSSSDLNTKNKMIIFILYCFRFF